MNARADVVIVGAGISGLSLAWRLHEAGLDVLVLEKEAAIGGAMKTKREGGWLVEKGPNSVLETTPIFVELFEQLEITSQQVYANPVSRNRYILRNGHLHAMPLSPGSLLRSSLLSLPAKLRLLKEPFVGKSEREESVAEFVERRFGREFLDFAVNPFVAGVFAGDPEQLSVQAAFPEFYALEEKYGSVMKGIMSGRKERRRRREESGNRTKTFSFIDGIETFPAAIASRLGSRVRTKHAVMQVIQTRTNGSGSAFRLVVENQPNREVIEAEAIVFSTPAYVMSELLRSFSGQLSSMLGRISYSPVSEVFLGFREDQVKRPLDGFGFLVPDREQRSILGTIWSSSIFDGRAPEGHVALTSFVGGTRQPDLTQLSDSRLIAIVAGELRAILGVEGDPVYSSVIRFDRAIPQYNLGYSTIMKTLEEFENENPGLFFCSNFRGGISVGDCMIASDRMAKRVSGFLRETSKKMVEH